MWSKRSQIWGPKWLWVLSHLVFLSVQYKWVWTCFCQLHPLKHPHETEKIWIESSESTLLKSNNNNNNIQSYFQALDEPANMLINCSFHLEPNCLALPSHRHKLTISSLQMCSLNLISRGRMGVCLQSSWILIYGIILFPKIPLTLQQLLNG